ncbi:NUDIX domain-containing protein [Candidatus Uhrbacteria bacterium]|nr:NUDIX domain-containing protein [Candidatus Uhrbacteria bacterium]
MDQVVFVDEEDNERGLVTRERAHRDALLHRIVVVYVVRENGYILIQERMSGRLDHSSAGHVDPGEDYLTAAKRELKEELSMACALTELGKIATADVEREVGGHNIRHMSMIYMCHGEPGALAKGEVKSVFWADPKKIQEDMQSDPGNEKYCGGFKTSLKFYLEKKIVDSYSK